MIESIVLIGIIITAFSLVFFRIYQTVRLARNDEPFTTKFIEKTTARHQQLLEKAMNIFD